MTRLYFLCEPGDGAVRYVGKTVKPLMSRLSCHLYEATRGDRNHRCTWIRSLSAPPEIVLIEEVLGDGSQEEIDLIAGLRGLGMRLVNGTSGGEGAVGYKHSSERREKIAASHRGRKASSTIRKKLAAAHLGKHPSFETRRRMSLAQKKRMEDPLQKAAFVALNVGRPVSAVTRAKISAAKRGA